MVSVSPYPEMLRKVIRTAGAVVSPCCRFEFIDVLSVYRRCPIVCLFVTRCKVNIIDEGSFPTTVKSLQPPSFVK